MQLSIGEKIALLRKKRNITQTQLAEYLCLAPQAVSRWEVGSGSPDIALLPKIAAFFGVSIDELFGLTSLERTEELVAKYSVLRDDGSFREAMEYIDSQLESIEAAAKGGLDGSGELQEERDRLEAEKVHMWIQLGREGLQRALAMAESFIRRTGGDPGHPWYLPMRLQRDQLRHNLGMGRETLSEREREYRDHPDSVTLLRRLALMGHRQEFERLLAVPDEGPARKLLFPPSEENLAAWCELIRAAAGAGDTGFIERHLPPVLAVSGTKEQVELLSCLLGIYGGEELAAIKGRLLELLPKAGLNPYFQSRLQERIDQA